MEKTCQSCGMPMRKMEEFGGMDVNNKYCVYCTNKKGILKPYHEKLKDYIAFIMRTTDLSQDKAQKMAEENLKKFPAWSHIK